MKVIDLVVLDFNLKLKDKTVFKVLNQIGHDKYIYNRKDRKFYVFEYETENENISLVIDSKTIAWEIEIIEEYNPIEKIFGLHHPSTKKLDLIREDIGLAFKTIDKLIDKVNELKKENE